MSRKKILVAVLSLYSMLLLSSCGSESPGGGTTEFKTTSISASPSTTRIESDLSTGNTCTNGASTGGTFVTDSIDVSVKSTLYTGATSGLPVAIDSYTVEFVPNATLSTSPPPTLSKITGTLIGQSVQPGGTLSIPVAVAPEALKLTLVNNGTIPLCSGTVYAYYALISFNSVEVGTGTRNTIGPISLDLVFADRTN